MSKTTPPPVEPEAYCIGLFVTETGEALQVLGNAQRFGLSTPEATGVTSKVALEDELGDILAAMRFASMHGIIDWERVEKRSFAKLDKLLDPKQRDNLGRRLAPKPPGYRRP